MARIRTIKPEFWTDEKLGPLDPLTRLVAIGLISQADDAGRILDSVRLIDGLLFAYDDSTTCRRSLDDLSRTGFIERGLTASGQAIIQITGWHHQKIDRPNLSAALPPICNDSTKDRRSLDEGSSNHINDLRSTIYDHTPPRASEEGEGDEVFGHQPPIVVKAIKGSYGWEGTEGLDERVWKGADGIDRKQCIAIAVMRLEAEGKKYHGRLFRSILQTVIEEQKAGGGARSALDWLEADDGDGS